MRRLETILILLSLGFYVWFVSHFGTREVFTYVQVAGWGLVLTVALETLARFANTLGWRVTIEDYPRSLGLGELFAARIAGEAVDYVTPSANLGGQFVMAMMVRRKLRMAIGLATVIIAALAEAVGQIAFVTPALLISLRIFPATVRLFWPIIAGLVIAITLVGAFFLVQRKRPFSHLWRIAARFDFSGAKREEIKAAADQADGILIDFYARHRVRLFLSCLCYLIAWGLGPLEIYILLRLLNQPVSLHIALLVEGVGLLIERVTFMIPAKLVSQEGGKALILGALGYPPGVGFAIGLLRRLKEMVWVMFGLSSLMLHRILIERAKGVERTLDAAPRDLLKIQEAQGD